MVNIYDGSDSQKDLEKITRQQEQQKPFVDLDDLSRSETPSFYERTRAIVEREFAHTWIGKDRVEDKPVKEQINIVKQNANLLGAQIDTAVLEDPDAYKEWARQNPNVIKELQTKHPELGLKNFTQIDEDITKGFVDLENARKRIDEHTNMNFISEIAVNAPGEFLGYVSSPAGAASLAIPGGLFFKTTTALKTFASLFTGGAAAIAAEQLVEKGADVAVRNERLGEDVTLGQAVKESATEVVVGATIGAALGTAVGAAVSKVMNRSLPEEVVAQSMKDRLAGNPIDQKATDDAMNAYTAKQLLDNKPENLSELQHEANLEEAVRAHIEGREPKFIDLNEQVPELKPELDVKTPLDYKKDVEPRVQELREQLKEQDIIFEDADGQSVSLRKTLNEMDKDSKALKLINDCLNGVVQQ